MVLVGSSQALDSGWWPSLGLPEADVGQERSAADGCFRAGSARMPLQDEMKKFLWIPGAGVDQAALERLCEHFHKPSEPMGEAWFMGDERQMFPELLGDLDAVSAYDLQKPLIEIASGTSSFGPMREWHIWYHYLLGRLVPRSHEAHVSYLLESLLTGFMAIYPNGVYHEPYSGFREDVLLTLGRSIMDSECWNGSDIAIGNVLRRSNNNPRQVWIWWDASGDLSASLFFCLKYLPESAIEAWLRSVLDIQSPHWRAQVLVWLLGAHEILNGTVRWPSEFSMEARPYIGWEWSHCLRPELAGTDDSGSPPTEAFIAAENRAAALGMLRAYFTEDRFLEWMDGISSVYYLETELQELPSAFESIYVRGMT